MHIAFRVDASAKIGTGHLMRCLALAVYLKKFGSDVLFVSRHLSDSLADLIVKNGISLKKLEYPLIGTASISTQYSEWLGVSQEVDAQATISALSEKEWDWLIIDHYSLDQLWERELKNKVTKKIMVIDDLANRQHDCDFLLDQNFYWDQDYRYKGKVPDRCRLFLGPKYALLRDEFLLARKKLRIRGSEVSRILIFFGGIDLDDYTSKSIKALSKISGCSFEVDVVIGDQHPEMRKILEICHKHGYLCHVQTSNMATLIANADIAIAAGGTATWERCALGLPTITIAVAENQRQLVKDGADACILYAPEIGEDLVEDLRLHISALLKNPILRNKISKNGMEFVDGMGGQRVAQALCFEDVELRAATEKDVESLFEWRNNPVIREVSRDTHLIRWEDHRIWYETVLARSDVQILIGSLGTRDVGVVRFNFESATAEISIYLIPAQHESGLGSALLMAAEKWIRNMHPGIKQIKAEVMASNLRSRKFFLKNGYSLASSLFVKTITQ